MSGKEAKARIKINTLLEEAGWRFFEKDGLPANVILENNTKITNKLLNDFGEDFEKTTNGFIDYLLLDDKGFPFIVLEAKREDLNPLFAKEQARAYANSQHCRFVILSNGNIHYFWDLQRGSPNIITKFPSPDIVIGYKSYKPNPQNLVNEPVKDDYIILTQKPDYKSDPRWLDESQRSKYLEENKLRLLRKYQVRAIERIQEDVNEGKDRFLFEMATGTGKTLTAAAVIKLFLRSGNARRVLFLVDRLELETQAEKNFKDYLKNDYQTCIYKENRDDWRKCEIVVSTVQSFIHNNKYKRIFTPTDFDLVISDEAHRSIGGNSRSVFEYFIGYKLGLTATPKDYLRKIDPEKLSKKDPRELERRMLLDTYRTFGCEDGTPTYRYSLIDGVNDGFLVNPVVVDARTDITTQLLSDEGYKVLVADDEGEESEIVFEDKDFEKRLFSEETNRIFCETFLKHALLDPVTGEIGKTIIFCVRQNHAAKIVQILNQFADVMFPGKYQSDFAMQVTSVIPNAQTFTVNFSNNKLSGSGNFNPFYKTSKTRVCVTVGMMTTGYDCQDILNVCLMRPIFSPTDFIQIKGRGTRKWNFTNKEVLKEISLTEFISKDKLVKSNFKLFDFFAVCEYFEEKFNYDEILELPVPKKGRKPPQPPPPLEPEYENKDLDPLKKYEEIVVGDRGMKIDRMYFNKFEDIVSENEMIKKYVAENNLDAAEKYVLENLFDKPEEYFNLEKLRQAVKVDRRLSLREILEKIFGFISYFKSKDELLEEEFEKFDSRYLPDDKNFSFAKDFFKTYISDGRIREIIESRNYALLNTEPNGKSFLNLSPELRKVIPEYIKDNISLNRFM